jgi:hypothetical protein
MRAMARKRARWSLVLVGALTAAGGVAVNGVGGSTTQQVAVFAAACASFALAGVASRWGNDGSRLVLRTADARGQPRLLADVELSELGVHWSTAATDGYGTYIERDVDRMLDEVITSGQVLTAVSGATLAGRTRTLAEAARRNLEGSWLAILGS